MRARIVFAFRRWLWNERARRMIRAQQEREDQEARTAQRLEWERRMR